MQDTGCRTIWPRLDSPAPWVGRLSHDLHLQRKHRMTSSPAAQGSHPPAVVATTRQVSLPTGVRLGLSQWTAPERPAQASSIVLVHGLGDGACVWQGIAPMLARSANVYALDLRGHGASDTPAPGANVLGDMAGDLLALLDTLELEQPLLIGHSLGAGLVVQVAAARAQRCAGVALIDYAPEMASASLARVQASLLESHQLYHSVEAYAAVLRRRHLLADPALVEAIARGSLCLTPHGYRPCFDLRLVAALGEAASLECAAQHWAALERLSQPTLVVRGAWSWMLSQASAQRVAHSCPRGSLAVVPQAGHSVQIDNPRGLLAALAWLHPPLQAEASREEVFTTAPAGLAHNGIAVNNSGSCEHKAS